MATDYQDICSALRAIPGVAEADVEPDAEGGGMGLLRLGLQPGVDEVAVATSVGRVLRERFGLGVDADRVQLVEEAEDLEPGGAAAARGEAGGEEAGGPGGGGRAREESDAAARAAATIGTGGQVEVAQANGHSQASPLRPAIQRMQVVSAGLDVTTSVTLAHAGRTSVGEASGTASQTGVLRAVAAATLQAVERLMPDALVRFGLDHLDVAQLGRDRTVVVALTMVSPEGSERLTGSAVVREDVRQAVIRATLNALNRRLEQLLPRPH